MSMMYCAECGHTFDTDYIGMFIHNNGEVYCEDCAVELEFEEGVNGHYG